MRRRGGTGPRTAAGSVTRNSYRACRDVTCKGAHVMGICQALSSFLAAGMVESLAEQVLSHTAHCAQIPYSSARGSCLAHFTPHSFP